MNCIEAFQQGARCGHSEGWNEPGYFSNEEIRHRALGAAYVQPLMGYDAMRAWRKGYELGFDLAHDGVKLPLEFQYPVDRKPESWA